MAGLGPATHESPAMPGWVYMMTNRPNGTLYLGVTDNLPAVFGSTGKA